ncbi:RadC family protein [Sphingomonas aerophila]|uniref:DNA repair protein RadC n=1 Tax=Sphingomonas aerophila TaxID=1344948 RepID=A0A7W9BEU4_9SPHN|nr:DNA repair protein RadC [Sphingomonas aerophila]MBB5715878.1 DNA repair protein RadC [Sphingomonas aerophila]
MADIDSTPSLFSPDNAGTAPAASDNQGHRARLRERLLTGGGLLDHELIEYLLALAIPRRDTKPLAKALLREFGGIGGVLTADAEALGRVAGMGETATAAVKIAHAAAIRLLQAGVAERPVLANWQALLDYLRADMAHHAIERFRVLHLNSKNMLIRDEVMSEGSIDQAAVHVREVIRRAIDLGSAAIILVHNHPSGDPSPSRADIDVTRAIADVGKRLGIIVHDHIIMGTGGHVSLRAQGLI